MDVVIIVAIAENGVIGREGGLPWRLSTDLKRFKARTMGHAVVMGRKTFDSIGKPLPGRLNIVVTRDRDWRREGVEVAHSLDDALTLAAVRSRCMPGAERVFVIGGGELYAQALGRADELDVTHVLTSVDGDTRFPPIDASIWAETASEDHQAGERDSHATRGAIYRRRASW